MGSLIEELRRREAAARVEADLLRVRIEELSADLARAEEQVTRLAIAREEVTRVLEEPAAAEPPAGQDGESAAASRPSSPIEAVTVPPRQDGADASVLPRAYRDLLDVAADAGRPLRACEFAAAAGLPTEKAKVEGLRSKLKLLAARSWLAPVLTAPPGGVGPAERGLHGRQHERVRESRQPRRNSGDERDAGNNPEGRDPGAGSAPRADASTAGDHRLAGPPGAGGGSPSS